MLDSGGLVTPQITGVVIYSKDGDLLGDLGS